MAVLLTGGAGYIGSHTCVELLAAGYDAVIIDNFSNSSEKVLERIREISGRSVVCYNADVCDESALRCVFSENKIDCVVHFAGLKAVGDSVKHPLEYYQNNLCATMTLLKVMNEFGVERIVFSSSATVYGVPKSTPIREDADRWCTNPYGWTKYMSEQIISDTAKADGNMSAVLLRYFNPIGAHESGRIGEDPTGIPNNLLPYITQVAVGRREHLNVFGNDYNTHDGTGVRDYLHVVDLAKGHIRAIEYAHKNTGVIAVNLGTGNGFSVLDIVKAFERATGIKIPYKIAPRRPGDIDECYADASLALEKLGWKAELSIDDMCRSAWNWQKNNPNGYGE